MKTSPKGFISPLLLALIAVLLVGGGAYVYVLLGISDNSLNDNICTGPNCFGINKVSTTTPTSEQSISTAQTAGWKKYTNAQYGFSVNYPSDWEINDQSYTYQGEQSRNIQILSPVRLPDNVRFSVEMYFKNVAKNITYSGLIKAHMPGDQVVTRVYLSDRDLQAAYPADFIRAQQIIESARVQ